MRIGIDARELCGHATGVGRYLGGLLRTWSTDAEARRHEFVLYAHGPIGGALDTRRFASRLVTGGGGTLWEQRALPAAIARDHLDVFFSPGYTAPLVTAVPIVVAIHDVSFAAHPEWFGTREGIRRRVLTRRAATRARAVITISEFSRGELIERLRLPPDKIQVVPPGIDVPQADRETAAEAGGSDRPRVLYVGSIFNRRHVPELIQAAGDLIRRQPLVSLDLVGDNRSHPHQDIPALIDRQRTGDRIRWHRYVSDADLGLLYRTARAFAFLSDYEGLGLTPLEALSVGVPSVLLDTPVARESCAGAALYAGRVDPAATAEALAQVLFDDGIRQRLLSAAPGVLARYDWTLAARRTLAVLEGAM